MGLIAAVGGLFTLITFSVEKVPQSVVILCVRVYSPGLIKRNCGFSELSSVPFVNSQSPVVPQFVSLYETDQLYCEPPHNKSLSIVF